VTFVVRVGVHPPVQAGRDGQGCGPKHRKGKGAGQQGTRGAKAVNRFRRACHASIVSRGAHLLQAICIQRSKPCCSSHLATSIVAKARALEIGRQQITDRLYKAPDLDVLNVSVEVVMLNLGPLRQAHRTLDDGIQGVWLSEAERGALAANDEGLSRA
jgi:hypothetical protein